MHTLNYYFIIITLVTSCFGFETGTGCKVIGDSTLLPIYKNETYPRFNNFITIKINSQKFKPGYCECYTETGNCLVELDSNENNKYYKTIVEFSMKTDLKSKTFDSIFNDYKTNIEKERADSQTKDNKPLPETHEINPETDYMVFSFDFEEIQNEQAVRLGSIGSFESAEEIVDDSNADFIYPLQYGIRDFGDMNIQITIGQFVTSNVVECVSSNLDFKDAEKTIHTRKNYKTLDIDCNWGNPTINDSSSSNRIFESSFKLLITIFSFFLYYLLL